MRRFVLPFVLISLSLIPVAAQAQMVVSSFSCRPQLPCDTSSTQFPAIHDLLGYTSICVSRYMPAVPGVPVFDETQGLDSGSCLTTNPQAFPATGTGPTIPHCCVKKFSADVCVVQCEIRTQ